MSSNEPPFSTGGTMLAVVIGCVGLYGLAAADAARREREIGIGKALGATGTRIIRRLLACMMRQSC